MERLLVLQFVAELLRCWWWRWWWIWFARVVVHGDGVWWRCPVRGGGGAGAVVYDAVAQDTPVVVVCRWTRVHVHAAASVCGLRGF